MAAAWEDKAKALYLSTDMSCREIAEKIGITPHLVSLRCTQGKWAAARKKAREKAMKNVVNKTAKKRESELSRVIASADKMAGVIAGVMADDQQFYRHIVKEDMAAKEMVFGKADTKAIRDMTAALKDLTTMLRDFYDVPTPAEKEARRIASTRLKMDQDDKDKGKEAKEIVVKMEGDAEEWGK